MSSQRARMGHVPLAGPSSVRIVAGQVWRHNSEERFMLVNNAERYVGYVITHRCDDTGRPITSTNRKSGAQYVSNYHTARWKFGSKRHDGYRLHLDVE